MKNPKLLQLLETVLGKGKVTSGDNIAFFSPFTSHYKPKLEIDVRTTADGNNPWHCWISNKGGKSIHTLFKALNLPKAKFDELSRIVKSTKYRVYTEEEKLKTVTLPEEYQPMWIPKENLEYRTAMHYLKGRGITIFDIIRYRIGYASDGDYNGKIIIPSYDKDGLLNYFVSRAYRDRGSKHKNPNVSKDIIGFEMLVNWNEPLVLCEGAFDAMAIKRNVIPLFGKAIQGALQKKIIQEHVEDVYICLDRDALKNALDISEQFMNDGLNVYFVELAKDDPSKLGFDKIMKLIDETPKMTFASLMKYRLGMIWN